MTADHTLSRTERRTLGEQQKKAFDGEILGMAAVCATVGFVIGAPLGALAAWLFMTWH